MAANEKQVGGTHYKSTTLPDHWDVVYRLNWCYLVGAATKYLWRLGKKSTTRAQQVEDIQKAIHYLEKKVEQLLAEETPPQVPWMVDDGTHPTPRRDSVVYGTIDGGTDPGPSYVNQDRHK